MTKSILITGGARSGKSRIAERWALDMQGQPTYIATGQAFDSEMADRIAKHQAHRGPEWETIQEPLDLSGALGVSDGRGPRLVDCLTLWLSNMMHENRDWEDAANELSALLPKQQSPVILVTNEVGSGIVPENALARTFRDAQGHLNQTIAAAADEVFLAVAGYPMKVKPNAL